MKALVVQTAFLGDAVLVTPLLSFLADQYQSVDVVCAPGSHELLETHPAVSNTIVFDKRGRDRGLSGIRHLARTLKALNYDVAYLPHRSLRSGLLAFASGIPRRVGFADSPWRWCYTETRPATSPHETLRNLALADCERSIPSSITLTQDDRATARRYLAHAAVGENEPFVVLAPGANWATKRWPYYPALAALLSPEMRLVSVGTDAERGIWPGGSGVVDLAGRLTIRESAAIIEMAVLAVTNDSAPLHIAGALGTPVVAIFGPTAPQLGFAPQGPGDRVVESMHLDCRPCSRHGGKRCPKKHHRCMIDLGVDEVAAAVLETIAEISEDTKCASS